MIKLLFVLIASLISVGAVANPTILPIVGALMANSEASTTIQDGLENAFVSNVSNPVVDSNGNIYIAFIVPTTTIKFHSSAGGGINLSGLKANSFILSKYSKTGKWIKAIYNDSAVSGLSDSPLSLAMDSSDNVYIGGTVKSGINGFTYQSKGVNTSDFFVNKYNSNLIFQWGVEDGISGVSKSNQTIFTSLRSIAVDTSGNLIVYGDINNTNNGDAYVGFDGIYKSANQKDIFAIKYSYANHFVNKVWSYQTGSVSGLTSAVDLVLDSKNDIYLTGHTGACLNVCKKATGSNVAGITDAFIIKISSAGSQAWIKQFAAVPAQAATVLRSATTDNNYIYTTVTYDSGGTDLYRFALDGGSVGYDRIPVWGSGDATTYYASSRSLIVDYSGNLISSAVAQPIYYQQKFLVNQYRFNPTLAGNYLLSSITDRVMRSDGQDRGFIQIAGSVYADKKIYTSGLTNGPLDGKKMITPYIGNYNDFFIKVIKNSLDKGIKP